MALVRAAKPIVAGIPTDQALQVLADEIERLQNIVIDLQGDRDADRQRIARLEQKPRGPSLEEVRL